MKGRKAVRGYRGLRHPSEGYGKVRWSSDTTLSKFYGGAEPALDQRMPQLPPLARIAPTLQNGQFWSNT